jgi:hypothetical protein
MKLLKTFLSTVLAFTWLGISTPSTNAASNALFVVKDASTLGTMDDAVRDRLVDLGFTVTIKSQGSATSSDATGKALVVISASVESGMVNTKYKNTSTPVLCMESYIFDDMKMTGTGAGTNYGTLSSQSKLTISNIGSPLAVGLTGSPTVASSNKELNWGKPSSSAIKVATAYSNSTRALVFAYEKGASMVGMNAPGRRVGFCMSNVGSNDLKPYIWEMFDAAVQWSARNLPALFVVGSTSLSAGDSAATNRLHALGFNVSLKGASVSHSTNAVGKSVVLISSSVSSGHVNTKFKNTTVPVVTMEAFILDDMEYVAGSSSNYGNTSGQTQVVITDSSHPLAARRSGTVTILNSAKTIHWGKALSGAIQVGHQVGNSSKDVIFAYEKGGTMDGGFIAPARRVSLFPLDTAFPSLNASGLAMFDAAMRWAIEQPSTITPTVAQVTINPAGGAYPGNVSVTMSTSTSGATIRYTTNGSTPTSSSTIYSGAFTITPPKTVKAVAFKSGYNPSPVRSVSYTVGEEQRVDTPNISPGGGTISPNTSCSIFVTTAGATIYYTKNGSQATTSSTKYTGSFLVNPGDTVRAIATAPGYLQSFEGFAFY